jgi:hypothetical protein
MTDFFSISLLFEEFSSLGKGDIDITSEFLAKFIVLVEISPSLADTCYEFANPDAFSSILISCSLESF